VAQTVLSAVLYTCDDHKCKDSQLITPPTHLPLAWLIAIHHTLRAGTVIRSEIKCRSNL